jgi:hypothetical protein
MAFFVYRRTRAVAAPAVLYVALPNIIVKKKMIEYAVFFRIGHAHSKLTRSIGLPCAADLPIACIG